MAASGFTSDGSGLRAAPTPASRSLRKSRRMRSCFFRLLSTHENQVDPSTERKSYEPGVGVKLIEEIWMRHYATRGRCRAQEARDHWQDRNDERDDRFRIGPSPVTIFAIQFEEVRQREFALPQNPIVSNQHP